MEKSIDHIPLVYVASPFAGDIERNIIKAQGYCRFVLINGCIPLAPHLHYPQFLDDFNESERELGINISLILLAKCDELWVFGGKITKGMKLEIDSANQNKMTVKYFDSKLQKVLNYE